MYSDQAGPTGGHGEATLGIARIMRALPGPGQAVKEYRVDPVENSLRFRAVPMPLGLFQTMSGVPIEFHRLVLAHESK